MKNLGPIFAIVIVIAVVLVIALRSKDAGGPDANTQPIDGIAASPAPDAGSVTLSGQSWRLKDQRGKVVLLDFWATWCGPCVASIPYMKALHEKYKDNSDFMLVGVSLDDGRTPLEQFIKDENIGWTQLFDLAADNEMARKFGVSRIPTTFLIDREGNIRGVDLPHDELEAEIGRLLKAGA